MKINLLPENLSVKKGTASLAKILRSVSLISLVLAITLGVGILGFFLISSFELRGIQGNVETLKNQIKAQETTEQRMVLLKDRLSKIKMLFTAPSISKPLADVSPLLSNLPPDSFLGELSVDSQKVDSALIFRNSSSLSSFFDSLESNKAFPLITLTSFGFNPTSGYLVGIRFAVR